MGGSEVVRLQRLGSLAERATDGRDSRVDVSLAEAQQGQTGLRFAPVPIRIAIRRLGGGEVASAAPDLADLVKAGGRDEALQRVDPAVQRIQFEVVHCHAPPLGKPFDDPPLGEPVDTEVFMPSPNGLVERPSSLHELKCILEDGQGPQCLQLKLIPDDAGRDPEAAHDEALEALFPVEGAPL